MRFFLPGSENKLTVMIASYLTKNGHEVVTPDFSKENENGLDEFAGYASRKSLARSCDRAIVVITEEKAGGIEDYQSFISIRPLTIIQRSGIDLSNWPSSINSEHAPTGLSHKTIRFEDSDQMLREVDRYIEETSGLLGKERK